MKRIYYILLLLLCLLLQSCGDYQIPKFIAHEQKKFEENPPKARTYNPDVILDPIEQIPDTTKKAFKLMNNGGNWGYKFLEVDQWEEFIKEKATRKVYFFIFDTGGDYDHPNLEPITNEGKVFTGESSALDANGHSTHCAGIIAGEKIGNSEVGICRVLREMDLVELRPYKVLSDQGFGSFGNITQGIRTANTIASALISDGHFVIYNFSLGSSSPSSAMDAELREAEEMGVLISMAANGNNGQQRISYPGSSQYTEGIVSITTSGKRSSFSNYGPESMFSLPGSGIYATYKNKSYAVLSGTSMASPHGAAVAGLLASVYKDASAAEIVAHMKKYSVDAGSKDFDEEYGWGIPKLTELFDNPIGGTPDEPDEPGDDEPDQPTEPDEPEPGPAPGPEKTDEFEITKTYRVAWRTTDNRTTRLLPFNLKTEFTHTLGKGDAADQLVSITDKFFRNRGLILAPGSDEDDVLKWAAYFYEMMLARDGYDVKPTRMYGYLDATRFEFTDFHKNAERKAAKKYHVKKSSITYDW